MQATTLDSAGHPPESEHEEELVQAKPEGLRGSQTIEGPQMQIGYFTERPYRWLPEELILKNRAFFAISNEHFDRE